MTDTPTTRSDLHATLTARIVEAYVARNAVPTTELPALIAAVHGAIVALGRPTEPEAPALVPPVPIRKTVTPDAIISLEDGKPYKSLKRHLSGRGLTPEQYRAKWGLPIDYPMVAANYAAQRSELAKSIGLGRKPALAAVA
ncbi:MucR family transcriptional regulator [Methylobacterium sp. ID0610]|uniref:MucR family transcriptional regulator n=1 Tax=Methylobacterium carpenticola TaxID=3344827 RepID=UPI0036BA6344